jgi:hypothetical protein
MHHNNTTGSILSYDLSYEIKGDERIMGVLIKELNDLKEKVHDLETQKIIDESGLPNEILEANNMFTSSPKRVRAGKGHRQLLQSEIEEAQQGTVNESQARRKLGVSRNTYVKYATLYGIYNPKPFIKGKRAIFDPNRGKYPLAAILEGKHPNVSIWTVKDKLLRSGIKKIECELCGYHERRIGDNKIPLLLNHMDDDITNHKLDNLKLMCLNCTFMAGRGYIRKGKFKLDADWMQDINPLELDKDSRY